MNGSTQPAVDVDEMSDDEAGKGQVNEVVMEILNVDESEDNNARRVKCVRSLLMQLGCQVGDLTFAVDLPSDIADREASGRRGTNLRWSEATHSATVEAVMGRTDAARKVAEGGGRVKSGMIDGAAMIWEILEADDSAMTCIFYDADMAELVSDTAKQHTPAEMTAGNSEKQENLEEEEEMGVATGRARRQGGRPMCIVMRELGRKFMRARPAERKQQMKEWGERLQMMLVASGLKAELDVERPPEPTSVSPEMPNAVDAVSIMLRIQHVDQGDQLYIKANGKMHDVKEDSGREYGVYVMLEINGKEKLLQINGGANPRVVIMGIHQCVGGLKSKHDAMKACAYSLEVKRPKMSAALRPIYNACMVICRGGYEIEGEDPNDAVCPGMVKYALNKFGPGYNRFAGCQMGKGCNFGGNPFTSCHEALTNSDGLGIPVPILTMLEEKWYAANRPAPRQTEAEEATAFGSAAARRQMTKRTAKETPPDTRREQGRCGVCGLGFCTKHAAEEAITGMETVEEEEGNEDSAAAAPDTGPGKGDESERAVLEEEDGEERGADTVTAPGMTARANASGNDTEWPTLGGKGGGGKGKGAGGKGGDIGQRTTRRGRDNDGAAPGSPPKQGKKV